MTENIFEGVKFGDKFIMRDGRKSVFIQKKYNEENKLYILTFCSEDSYIYDIWEDDGKIRYDKEQSYDIVSRWKEPIDEEKLDELVHKHIDEWEDILPKTIMAWADGFKAGYRKAMEE